MTLTELNQAMAAAPGASVKTIRRRSLSVVNPLQVADPDPRRLRPPQ